MKRKWRRYHVFTAAALILSISAIPSGVFASSAGKDDFSQHISQDVERNVSQNMTIEEFAAGVAERNSRREAGTGSVEGGTGGTAALNEAEPYSSPASRLIVKAECEPDVCGADEIFGGYDGYYIVQYEDEESAEAGKEFLLSQDSVQCVAEDEKLQLYASGSADYEYQALKKWSAGEADPLGIEYINEKIMEKYDGSIEALPDVTVAVIDSGVMSDHPFLSGRLTGGMNLSGDDPADVSDGVGHGTSVAGIITDTSLPNVSIMPVRVADDEGNVYVSAVIAGVKAAQEAGAEVINMSLGGKGKNSVLESAILEAEREGIVCVAAAGNKSEDVSEYYPANIESVVAVSNLSDKDTLYSGSNFGSAVDLAAPGIGICTSSNDGKMTESFSGTSAAAPFVSAAAAIVCTFLYDPDSGQLPDAESIISCLYENAVDIGEPGKDDLFGYGRLNFVGFDAGTAAGENIGDPDESDGPAGEGGADSGDDSDDDNDGNNPENPGDQSGESSLIRMEKTYSGYIAEYGIPDDIPGAPALEIRDLMLCIAQYDRSGKMLDYIVRQCTDRESIVWMADAENAAEARAFLLIASSCRAVAACAAVSDFG